MEILVCIVLLGFLIYGFLTNFDDGNGYDKFEDSDVDTNESVEETVEEKPKTKIAPSNVVAPVKRNPSSKKITLTATQVSMAKRLGVPLEEYAKQVAQLNR